MVIFLTSGAYLGLAPFAPGTFGSLAGLPLWLLIGRTPLFAGAALLALAVGASIYLAGRAEKIYGRHDDQRIVIDEVVGIALTLFGAEPGWTTALLGFILFRLFDITKPWPCRTLDRRVPGGLGVVLDDLAAGLYAGAILMICLHLWPALGQPRW
ncbi:MAG: phosphatidylglycerophosphatase A [Pseudomonadota bacterium]